ncbi:MAG: UDP-3-O-acyl-N-acetylglucosamine deacetylase [Rhizomicrobium sp.]
MNAYSRRHTLAKAVHAEGIALHAGIPVRMHLLPAEPDTGIIFRRDDLGGAEIPARFDRVCETRLGTVIAVGPVRVGVIEHVMAALSGAGVDDVVVVLEGPEPPILDGSAAGYLALIEEAGLQPQFGRRQMIEVLRRVEVTQKDAQAVLSPAAERSFEFLLDYDEPVIGRQHYDFPFSTEGFKREIAPACTFGFVRELEALHQMGLGRGASLENTLALEPDKILNPDKMHFADEFVRHKILDAIGDLALAGAPILGRFTGIRSGHGLNNALLRLFLADSENYRVISVP